MKISCNLPKDGYLAAKAVPFKEPVRVPTCQVIKTKDNYKDLTSQLAKICNENQTLFARLELLKQETKSAIMSFAEQIATQGIETTDQLFVLTALCTLADKTGNKDIKYYYRPETGFETTEHYILMNKDIEDSVYYEQIYDVCFSHGINELIIQSYEDHDNDIYDLNEFTLIRDLNEFSDSKIYEMGELNYQLREIFKLKTK